MYQDSYRPPTQFSVFPPVIKNLLILNGLFFFAAFVAASTNSAVLQSLLNWMALYPPGIPEDPFGRQLGYTLFGRGEIPGFWPWQLLTYGFLHVGFGHILSNMFALWMFGVQIENTWGSRRFAVYYFVCVVGAALLHLLVTLFEPGPPPPVPTIGASGGVFGILLAFGMMFPNQYIMLLIPPIPIKAKWFVIIYGVIELFAGVRGAPTGVAHFAHLGGMLFGFVLIQYWRGKLPVRPQGRIYW
jgi:membrane associated rhomboid family serine protease